MFASASELLVSLLLLLLLVSEPELADVVEKRQMRDDDYITRELVADLLWAYKVLEQPVRNCPSLDLDLKRLAPRF